MRAISLLLLSRLLSLLLLGCTWSASALTLTVAVDRADNRPFEYVDEHGKLTGFHIETIRLVAERLGWDVRFRQVAWPHALSMLQSGQVDALSFVSRSPEREAYAAFRPDNMLHIQRVGIYIKRDRAADISAMGTEAFMRRWKVGVARGYHYNDEIDSLLQNGVPADTRADSQSALLYRLLAGQVDAAILVGSALNQGRRKMPDLDQRILRVDTGTLAGNPVYVAFSRKRQGDARAAQFAQAFTAWRGLPEYHWLAQRYGVLALLPDLPAKTAAK